MKQDIPVEVSTGLMDWNSVVITSSTMPPRDPDDDEEDEEEDEEEEEEDEEEDEDEDDEPAVVREPDED